MKGLVLINAYYDSPPYRHQYGRIAEELEKAGAIAEIRRNDFFPTAVSAGEIELRARGYDFCVYLDKDKYASETMEKCGLRLFNSHAAVAACDDKMLTFIRLAGHGIPMPNTLPAPLCYRPEATVSAAEADKVIAALGCPIVVKTAYGSLGKGVFKADGRDELLALMNELKLVPHLYQRFVNASAGKDLRVMVVGGKTAGGMLRSASDDFRSNVGAGGHGSPFPVDAQTAALCEKIARLLSLDFCGIDLLSGENGYLLCEVNSNAFFAEFEKVTSVNVAKLYAEHIIKTVSEAKKTKTR